jgi:acetyltransferase-like isoleucine patch superfamily enzyme
MAHKERFFFNPIQLLSIRTSIDIKGKQSIIRLGHRVTARPGVTIAVRNGNLEIGANVFFNKGCSVTCHENIRIGDNCLFGQNVLIFDHDHIFGQGKTVNREGFKKSPVEIGSNVWVGANTIILRGSNIGDNCVIAAGTIVKGNIPSESVVYQKRELTIKPVG